MVIQARFLLPPCVVLTIYEKALWKLLYLPSQNVFVFIKLQVVILILCFSEISKYILDSGFISVWTGFPSVSVFVRRTLAELAVSGKILLWKKNTIFFNTLYLRGGRSELGGYVRQILSILKVNREE